MEFPDSYPIIAAYLSMTQAPHLTPSHSQPATSEQLILRPEDFNLNGFEHTQRHVFPGYLTPPATCVTQDQLQQTFYQDGEAATEPVVDVTKDIVAKRCSNEDGEMMTAMSKRRAQNRAAQRAYRERRDRHLNDLETEIANLKAKQEQFVLENERLKRSLKSMSVMNGTTPPAIASMNSSGHVRSHQDSTTCLMQSKSTGIDSTLVTKCNEAPSHCVGTTDSSDTLFTAGATWDYILEHYLYKRGLVNMERVCNSLRYAAKFDHQQVRFPEEDIMSAIEQGVVNESNDLL